MLGAPLVVGPIYILVARTLGYNRANYESIFLLAGLLVGLVGVSFLEIGRWRRLAFAGGYLLLMLPLLAFLTLGIACGLGSCL